MESFVTFFGEPRGVLALQVHEGLGPSGVSKGDATFSLTTSSGNPLAVLGVIGAERISSCPRRGPPLHEVVEPSVPVDQQLVTMVHDEVVPPALLSFLTLVEPAGDGFDTVLGVVLQVLVLDPLGNVPRTLVVVPVRGRGGAIVELVLVEGLRRGLVLLPLLRNLLVVG